MNSIAHRHLVGIAGNIKLMVEGSTISLHNAIEMLNAPGGSSRSTGEAVKLVGSAFAALATLQVSQVYQQELLVAHMKGEGLTDVRDRLLGHLVATTRGMSMATAVDEDGETFAVGALSRHFQEQLADSYSQAAISIENIIATETMVEAVREMANEGKPIMVDDPDADLGNIPSAVFFAERRVPRYSPEAASPRAG